MMKRLAAVVMIVPLAITAGCNSGGKKVATVPTTTATTSQASEAPLKAGVRSTLSENRRLSIYVLWNNRIPSWAAKSTRGPALASLRAAAQNRRHRGIRVRLVASRRQIISIRLDPSYLRAKAIILDRQRVQPSQRNGRPLGQAVMLKERARYELRRIGRSNRFVVWRVVLLK
jgi:hypothetical protein